MSNVGFDWFQPSSLSVARKWLFQFLCYFWLSNRLTCQFFVELNIFFCKLTDTVKTWYLIPTTSWKGIISCCNGNGLINHGLNVTHLWLLIWSWFFTIFCWYRPSLCLANIVEGIGWIEALQPFQPAASEFELQLALLNSSRAQVNDKGVELETWFYLCHGTTSATKLLT